MEAVRGNRGSRPPADISLISGFVKSYLPQVVGVLSDSDLHDLSNEIDWVTANNNSIVFLQNEQADCYYLIGKGSVNLYYEADDCVSRALQMSFRPASCSQLGSYLGQLIRGHGFGEYALLANNLSKSATNPPKRRNKDSPWPAKPLRKSRTEEQHQPAGRSCTAVCSADDTLLFVVYEATYNRIFKKFHHTQRQMAHCIHFMQKLPIFRHASLAKVTQVAFKTTKTKLPFKAVLGECGFNIECVSVVISGVVRVGARPETASSSSVLLDDAFTLESPSVTSVETGITNMTNVTGYTGEKGSMVSASMLGGSMVGGSIVSSNSAIPPLPSIATLKAGQIVGDLEVRKGLNTYKFHYDVQSLSVEVLQIPHEVYLECARDAAFNDTACANLTILPEAERAQRSAERRQKLNVVHGCDVSPSVVVENAGGAEGETETPRSESSTTNIVGASSEEDSSKKVSFQDDQTSPRTTPHTVPHTKPPQTAPTPHSTTHHATHTTSPLVPPLNLSATAPPMFSPLASPPRTARPSKTSYRTHRTQRSTSLGGAESARSVNSVGGVSSGSCVSNTPRSSRVTRAELTATSGRTVYGEQTTVACSTDRTGRTDWTDGSTVSTSSAIGAVFSPAPPIGASPRVTRPGLPSSTQPQHSLHTQHTPHTSQTLPSQTQPLGAGYVDIADPAEPLEGRYPEPAQGPNACTSYASSAAEAAQAVAREMQAIRQRVRVKQKSLGAEDIRLDPAGL